MLDICLDADDLTRVEAVLAEILGRHTAVDDDLLHGLTTYAQELPRSLRVGLNRFRLDERGGARRVRGFRVDDERIGPTPEHWNAVPTPSPTFREEVFLLLCGSLLGDAIGWATQQDQRLVHDVLPIKGHETMQINSASDAEIWWHTEDAFHPYRTDYVALMCLRNDDGTPTTFAAFDDVPLSDGARRVLAEPRFVIRPDASHLPEGGSGGSPNPTVARRYAAIEEMRREPSKIAVLFGSPEDPYLRLDPFYMDATPDDPEATAAMGELTGAIDAILGGVALTPGEVLIVDNFRAVHGRRPFTARYDGRDRWLKRIHVVRDLRKSRDARTAPAARVVY